MPPDPEAPTAPRYAHPVESIQSSSSNESIFCSTCLKNQYFYNEALSNYLPESDDPAYAECVTAEPIYRRQLEDRYPQCCARCAPKVEERMRHAAYTAKSDHMRRLLDGSRRARVADRLGWRSLLVRLGGMVYVLSTVVDICWHIGGVGLERYSTAWLQFPLFEKLSPTRVWRSSVLIKPAFVASILTVWWNPKWQHKISGKFGRLRGLSRYYHVQAFLLVIRFVAWQVSEGEEPLVSDRYQQPVHCLATVAEIVLFLWSMLVAISIDTAAFLNWQYDIATPAFSHGLVLVEARSRQAQLLSDQTPSRFPISNLEQTHTSPKLLWQPPTLSDDYDPDKMDIDYPETRFRPRPRPVEIPTNQPSPFYGTIPTVPIRFPGHLKSQQEAQKPPRSLGLAPGLFDKLPAKQLQQSRSESKQIFRAPRLQTEDQRRDTGLEDIFGTVFSIEEETPLLRDIKMLDAQPSIASSSIPASDSPTDSLSITAIIFALSNAVFVMVTDRYRDEFFLAKTFVMTLGIAMQFVLMTSTLRTRGTIFTMGFLGYTLSITTLATCLALAWSSGMRVAFNAAASIMLLSIWPQLGYFASQTRSNDCDSATADSTAIQTQNSSERSTTTDAFPSYNGYTSTASSTIPLPDAQPQPQSQYQPKTRPRADSDDSITSGYSINTSATSSTAPGWKTPKISNSSRMSNGFHEPGYVLSFDRLGLGGFGESPGGGRSVAGPRNRAGRGGMTGGR